MNEEEKVLHSFYVAGVKFHQLKNCIKEVEVGTVLIMKPEPTNKYDPNAVRLEFASLDQDQEFMLGYVPAKSSAEVSAELVISNLKCIVTEVNPGEKPWVQLKVAIVEE